ncbi:alpha-1,4-L-rhamnosidase [uncultured Polaribacter sp.]|uniref:alpha-1,4-L-rhamnosidase n=1 Tax=uncultured Polaribacter sp. TaxID=174711 RepID=UPI002626B896|nr:alpha-1,4-L-rhamnosidase [uncultured Polaribacter sp.]
MNKKITLFQVVMFCLCFSVGSQAQIVLKADYTDNANAKKVMPYHLNVYNRITPINGVNPARENKNAKFCIVRPLGGIAKKGIADVTKDSYKWDTKSKKFYTDFTLLKKQIDGVFDKGLEIHQIVLDNPSWAFQRNSNGILVGDSLKVATYGNAEPPRDYKAWANYLKEVMHFLIATYGSEKIVDIQFNIGREIGTPSHWSGTREQFFEFYKISTIAIRAVLPKAKVGTHFLWGSSKNAWGTDFVKWAYANKVHYDFVGVSYYPFYQRSERTNFDKVYAKDFAVIKDLPEWNTNAKLEMHEYSLIKSLSKAGNSFKKAPDAHQNSFMVGLMKMFYQNNMQNIFQWGDGSSYLPASNLLLAMQGNTYFESKKEGKQQEENNYIDAIFTKDAAKNKYNVLAYNYSANPNANNLETVKIKAIVNVKKGTKVKYRIAKYNKTANSVAWSNWLETFTQEELTGKSSIVLSDKLPVFSFFKYELVLPIDSN